MYTISKRIRRQAKIRDFITFKSSAKKYSINMIIIKYIGGGESNKVI